MADRKALLSGGVAVLTFVCFVLGAVAVALPTWGYFYNPDHALYDQGYFGPWRVCKVLLYNREKCGDDVARFRPSSAVYMGGVAAAIGVTSLGAACILAVLQLAMRSSHEQLCMPYTHTVMLRLALVLLAALLSVVAAGLFAVQIDDRASRGFIVVRGEAFYIQVVCIILNAMLSLGALYDALWSRRSGGDPTAHVQDTVHNPGYKEGRRGVAVTHASGRPYAGGSVASVDTTATTLTGLSTETAASLSRSPLRSSLKKPRPAPGLGIHNPGYSGNSPPLGRNGSVKKVRIQTHSTEV